MKTKSSMSIVRDALSPGRNIGRKANGNIVVRRGYFYTNGCTAEKFCENVAVELDHAGVKYSIVGHGDHWAPFRGGASVANSSHWWVELRVENTL